MERLLQIRTESGCLSSIECEDKNGRHGDITGNFDGVWYCLRCGW